jgi:hypothetical protein
VSVPFSMKEGVCFGFRVPFLYTALALWESLGAARYPVLYPLPEQLTALYVTPTMLSAIAEACRRPVEYSVGQHFLCLQSYWPDGDAGT